MKEQTKIDIKEHALSVFPQEACGFVISVNGVEKVVRGENISEKPEYHFTLSPKSFMKAKSMGDILAVYHSHPNSGLEPSQADITACERSGYPWIIYSNDGFHFFAPSGKKTPLLGRQYVWGVHDCFTLIRDYYEEQGLILPDFQYEERFWEKEMNLYEDNLSQNGFIRVSFDDVKKNDLLLFCVHSKVPNHAGVYIDNNKMIHQLFNRLSCRDLIGMYWRNVMHGCFRNGRFSQ